MLKKVTRFFALKYFMVSSKIEPFNTYVGVRMCFIVLNVPCVHLNNEIIPTGRSESKVKQIYMF